jgi:hypothetical protein
MCRYAAMTRPSPSTKPYEPLPDPRAELLRQIEEKQQHTPRYHRV